MLKYMYIDSGNRTRINTGWLDVRGRRPSHKVVNIRTFTELLYLIVGILLLSLPG